LARMKYMGSKRSMLRNGLGTLLDQEGPNHKRFFDLFSGSGAVAIHVAKATGLPVFSYDLQSYSASVSGAIIERTSPFDPHSVWEKWERSARSTVAHVAVPLLDTTTAMDVATARRWSSEQEA